MTLIQLIPFGFIKISRSIIKGALLTVNEVNLRCHELRLRKHATLVRSRSFLSLSQAVNVFQKSIFIRKSHYFSKWKISNLGEEIEATQLSLEICQNEHVK